MTDNGHAALAAVMEKTSKAGEPWATYPEWAAAILEGGAVFLPDGHPLGVEDAIAQGQARIAALNARIVDLNAEVLDRMDQWYRDSLARDELARQQNGKIATLRAALDAGATLLGYMDYGRMRVGGDEANRAYLAAWRAARAALATAREVNAIVAAERERIVAEVKALPTLVLPTGTYVDVEDVFDVIEP